MIGPTAKKPLQNRHFTRYNVAQTAQKIATGNRQDNLAGFD